MKLYIISAISTVFLSVLCSIIIPEGRLKKTVNFSLRMICMLALIQPIKDFFTLSDGESLSLIDYEFVCQAYENSQEEALKSAILSQFNENCKCDIEISYEDGEFRQKYVYVYTESKNSVTNNEIYAYLQERGYININVI